jgi:hypothetical protein
MEFTKDQETKMVFWSCCHTSKLVLYDLSCREIQDSGNAQFRHATGFLTNPQKFALESIILLK